MKFWTFAGFLTGLVIITVVVRKIGVIAAKADKNLEKRYSIDDLIAEQEL